MKLTAKQKFMNKVSDIRDDIDILLRRDLSLRFRILNLLSGDRIRTDLAVASWQIRDAISVYNTIPEHKALCDGEMSAEDYEHIIDRMMWYIKRADKNIKDICVK